MFDRGQMIQSRIGVNDLSDIDDNRSGT